MTVPMTFLSFFSIENMKNPKAKTGVVYSTVNNTFIIGLKCSRFTISTPTATVRAATINGRMKIINGFPLWLTSLIFVSVCALPEMRPTVNVIS